MLIRFFALVSMLLWLFSPALAENLHHPQFFHAFTLESDIGLSNEGSLFKWDVDGWLGGDYHKLWLRSEGERVDEVGEETELWALYSGNVSDFWDLQLGARQDLDPRVTTYLTFGVHGLAPYYFETDAHFFVSNEGDLSFRLRQNYELLFSQDLILEPYLETNLFASDVESEETGAGVRDAQFGLQLRYEITRKFAPYIDIRYERTFGESSGLARKAAEHVEAISASLGLRLLF